MSEYSLPQQPLLPRYVLAILQTCFFWPEMFKFVLHSNWQPARFLSGGASAMPQTHHQPPSSRWRLDSLLGTTVGQEPQRSTPGVEGGHRPLKNSGKTTSRVLLTPLFLSLPLSFTAPAEERVLQSSGTRQAVVDKEAGGGTRETNAGSAGVGRRRGRGDPARPRWGERPL